MINIVEDLEEISKLETDKEELLIDNFNISIVAQEAIDQLEMKANDSNISLLFSNESSTDFVIGDRDKIQQVFMNLISNSIKYGKEGGKTRVRFFDMNENNLYNQLNEYCIKHKEKIDTSKIDKIKKSLQFLKNKEKTLEDIYNNSKYIISDNVQFNNEDLKLIDTEAKKIIVEFVNKFSKINDVKKETLEPIVNELIKSNNTNFKGVGQPLRIALTGSKFGPGIYDIIISLGKDEVTKRLISKKIS